MPHKKMKLGSKEVIILQVVYTFISGGILILNNLSELLYS